MSLEGLEFTGLIRDRKLDEISGPEFQNALRKCGWSEGSGTHFFQQLRKDGPSRGIFTPGDLARAVARGRSEAARDGKMVHRICGDTAYVVYSALSNTLITFSQGSPKRER